MRSFVFETAVLSAVILAVVSCGTKRKLQTLRSESLSAVLCLAEEPGPDFSSAGTADGRSDTLLVTDMEGRELTVMKARFDSVEGTMVAHDVLRAAVVTARFRNIAERHGEVELEFEIRMPAQMRDSRWQTVFTPEMYVMGDTVGLEKLVVTGSEFRRFQLKGYQRYNRFINSIITDSASFVDLRNLEIFLSRNIPALYALKSDSTFVSDEKWTSLFGVSEAQATEHYTNKFARRLNARKSASRDRMYAKYIKVPMRSQGIRLDTLLASSDEDFVFLYRQRLKTSPKLRKVEVSVRGDIYEPDGTMIYAIPPCEPLVFYISSVSSFADETPRYKVKVISRNVGTSASYNIDFALGKAEVDPSLSENAVEIDKVRRQLSALLSDPLFELDSIMIYAYASPDGLESANLALCGRRAAAVGNYFERYLAARQDSLLRSDGEHINVAGDEFESAVRPLQKISFKSRPRGENWALLSEMINRDTEHFSDSDRSELLACCQRKDRDKAEAELKKKPYFPYLKDVVYPRLRTVQFNFYLHRKGMVKDTVHTSELDSSYMEGVKAIKERDYVGALKLLNPYNDFNTALAHLALDHNYSAQLILETLGREAKVNYLLSIVYSRQGRERDAVECYLRACGQDRSFVFRGNLDPEISALIRNFNLNQNNTEL